KPDFDAKNAAEQDRDRKSFEDRQQKTLVSYEEAVRRRSATDWKTVRIDAPAFLGPKMLSDYPLADLVPYIDWSPFFQTWELRGKYPAILTDAVVGEEASRLFADAKKLLDKIVTEKLLHT